MSPRSPKQFQDIRTEKRQRILDSALMVFSQKGYHGASISSIATEAKISKGLIYNYFHSKESILKETLIAGMEYMFSQFIFDPNTISKADFSKHIIATFDQIDEDFSYWRIYFSVIMQTEVMELIKTDMMNIAIPVFTNISHYMAKYGFADPEKEARFFSATLDGLSLNYITDPVGFPKEYCIDRIKSIYNLSE